MSPAMLTHPTKRHPLTGLPLQAVGHRRDGRPVWPILGASPDDPNGAGDPIERPEGIAEDEWTALGDPGKRAIVRERERADTAERSLAAARQRPAPPKPPEAPKAPEGGGKPGEQPDFAALIQQAVSEAVKPFRQAEEQRQTQEAAAKVQQAVIDAAKTRLHDATDALVGIDLTAVVNEQGAADPAKVKTALDDLVTRKPHLAKTGERQAPLGIGGGAPAATTDGDKVKAVLADMQRATGVRPPAPITN